MNALEVEEYIMARSTGYVDGDVLELVLGSPSQQPQDVTFSRTSQAPKGFLNLDTFFPTEPQQQQTIQGEVTESSNTPADPRPQVVRVSQRRLIRNIASIFVCVTEGPAFYTHSLERTIYESSIELHSI